MDNKPVLGIDIGGTNIGAGIVVNDVIEERYEIPTDAEGTHEDVLEPLITKLKERNITEFEYIGVAVPGFLDVGAGVIKKINNIPGLENIKLKDYISNALQKPVRIENDANCFVLGEYYFGKAAKYDNVIGITLGTGLGGGIIINRKIYSGQLGGAGEFGLLPYLDGIVEHYCSGQFFRNYCPAPGNELYEQAISGNKAAIRCFEEFGRHLGHLLNNLSICFSPQAFILGGTVARSFDFFAPTLKQYITAFREDLGLEAPEVIKAKQDYAGLLGAAALWRQ